MKVLIACEESQRVCTAFRERGHEAYSADILEPSGNHPEWHILGDVLEVLNPKDHLGDFEAPTQYISFKTMDGSYHEVDKWDMIIAHPPCTYLTNAGARHLWKGHKLNEERYKQGLEAKAFFMNFYNADCDKICVENPIPSKVFEMPPYSQTIQPYMFGHPYTKRTCLWLKGLPPLQPTNEVEPVATWCPSGSYSHKHGEKHRGMFTKDRPRQRSKTFEGIAAAMAEQWGENSIDKIANNMADTIHFLEEDNANMMKSLTNLQLAYNEQMIELREAKRLLKAAVEDNKCVLRENFGDICQFCKHYSNSEAQCRKPNNGSGSWCCKNAEWRYAAEALKLLGGSENGFRSKEA